MPETELQTPFGVVRLIADGGEATPWRMVRAATSDGRVDECRRAAIRRPGGEARRFGLVLEWETKDGFRAGFDSGEGLEASRVDGPGLAGSVGLPDGEAIDAMPGLRLASVSAAATHTFYEIDIEQGAALAIPAAAAWTLTPKTEAEEIAPWFAIDDALRQKD